MTTRFLIAAALLAALLALGGCGTKIVTTEGATPLNTVSAAGTGDASAAPDEAEMSFGVVVRDPKADEALKKASAAADTIIAAVKKAGVASEDVQTQNLSVYPEYRDGKDSTLQITGYTANVSVRAKIRDIEKVGEVIAAASGAGANEISGPTFTLSDEAPARDEAIEKAIEDARRRAEVMAKAVGKRLGEVVSVSEQGVTVPVYYARAEAAYDYSATPKIEPGTLEVTASVTVVFELK